MTDSNLDLLKRTVGLLAEIAEANDPRFVELRKRICRRIDDEDPLYFGSKPNVNHEVRMAIKRLNEACAFLEESQRLNPQCKVLDSAITSTNAAKTIIGNVWLTLQPKS